MEQQTFQNDLKSILATSWKRFGPMLANVRIHNNVSINIDIISERFFYDFRFGSTLVRLREICFL